MGAWGTEIWANDDAMDWMVRIERPVRNTLENDDATPQEWRAAADVAKTVPGMGSHVMDLAEIRLREILADDEWMDSWNDRGEVEAMLREELRWFEGTRRTVEWNCLRFEEADKQMAQAHTEALVEDAKRTEAIIQAFDEAWGDW